ncbi:hypothetical protein EST38_g13584 [Candolleomyces aberdarensis]|uniref:T6SS Phospholipase effector Tle1-like catalytic domain-containing protein n=1 Tax=Candolleomyces aberdarensis TaxID=2316362 RepID=A0A4Q2D0D6_9AGAR|nr:hypothetical protein EST38_g13584 [Candolleomyces aberdarensis]
MFADTIDAHIMGGYKFLMQSCEVNAIPLLVNPDLHFLKDKPGDRICIFGFSRGAYTARCLAGMLHKVGLLPPNNSEQVPFAYTIFRRTVDAFGRTQAKEFKRAFSTTVDIEFLGVWDTVGSVGFRPEKPPFSASTTFIKTYRHAISLDERRAKFQANPWNKHLSREEQLEARSSSGPSTDIQEVWFAGCHSGTFLTRIPLRWMVREIFRANAGVLFLTDRLYTIGLDPSTIYPLVRNRPAPLPVGEHQILEPCRKELPFRPSIFGPKYPTTWDSEPPKTGPAAMLESEEHEELKDALSPIYDHMSIKKWWWLLEYIPLPLRCLRNGKSTTRLGFNLGRPRVVESPMLHRSVKMRMEAKAEYMYKKYEPKAKLPDSEKPTWVD